MNYFAHGRSFIHDPYYLAGTAVPDWLNVVDRKLRVRSKQAALFVGADDPHVALVARGILQHCRDDDWFHATRAFAETSMALCVDLRERLPPDDGFRPHFLGHILTEIVLDAELIEQHPGRLEEYYAACDGLDGAIIERAVGEIAGRSAQNLGTFVGLFSRERFLWDYLDDGKLLVRLNQVMRRVGLPLLPHTVTETLQTARKLVRERAAELLDKPAIGQA